MDENTLNSQHLGAVAGDRSRHLKTSRDLKVAQVQRETFLKYRRPSYEVSGERRRAILIPGAKLPEFRRLLVAGEWRAR